ncbi:MAG: DNA mismatch repair endonuclease MutL [Clostridia bacterium]|nr:DNA mismatch repair endonuclease MutL [Clostridia bacterium]
MPKINLLEKHVCELIAAGEVVERPASVIKELVENSIDAGASIITVEIKNGGISYMRITDNGCGISQTDVPLAFLRHATSKITDSEDLNSISTLGFRGEALAAVSSVAKMEMLTKTREEQSGTYYKIEGGIETENSPSGCPDGTTIIIKDLFYNTPARMKFLKKDVSEGNACASVLDRIALSHPEISFKFIRDGKLVLSTNGDGNLKNTVYSVLGKEFSNSLIEVEKSNNSGIAVSGLICKPFTCKSTRSGQYTFLNGRLVRSGTVVAAVEQAYKNSAMVGKFPAFILFLNVPFDTVDVNVHPAKTEVRFSDEKRIFDSVYASTKNALAKGDTRPEVKVPTNTFNPFVRNTTDEYKQTVIPVQPKTIDLTKTPPTRTVLTFESPKDDSLSKSDNFVNVSNEALKTAEEILPKVPQMRNPVVVSETVKPDPVVLPFAQEKPQDVLETVKFIGEAFATYIVAEFKESVFLIDKHAAHERILFNELKNTHKTEVQALLTPFTVTLSREEYDALTDNIELLLECGFDVEDFGNSTVTVRAIPTTLVGFDLNLLMSEIAEGLLKFGKVEIEARDHLFHTVACKAAIKAGSKNSIQEMQILAEKVLLNNDILYCPHGRPVAFEIKKRELEKMFGRIQ